MRLAKVSARSEEMSLCLGEGQTLFLVEDLAAGDQTCSLFRSGTHLGPPTGPFYLYLNHVKPCNTGFHCSRRAARCPPRIRQNRRAAGGYFTRNGVRRTGEAGGCGFLGRRRAANRFVLDDFDKRHGKPLHPTPHTLPKGTLGDPAVFISAAGKFTLKGHVLSLAARPRPGICL